MGFFETIKTGYSIMWNDAKRGWQNHGAQILTGGGTSLLLLANGLFTRKALKEETRKAIEHANQVIAEIENAPVVATANVSESKAKNQKRFKLAKAKAGKLATYGKKFWKEAAVSVAGAVMVGAGQHMNTKQKTLLASGIAAVSAEFASYRANVIADQGEDKDLEYLTKKVGKKASGNATGSKEEPVIVTDENGVTVQADPTVFKLFLSPETTPWLYSDNLFMTKANIEDIERTIERIGWKNGIISLNDMRRECASMNNPRMFDVGVGGIFGKTFAPYRGDDGHVKYPHFQLGGWRDDVDFMEGRKVGVWIIFPCDSEPIIGKIDAKALAPIENQMV